MIDMMESLPALLKNVLKTQGAGLLEAAVIIAAGMLLARLLCRLLKKAIAKTRLDPTYHRFFLSLLKYSLYVVVWIFALSQLEVDTSSIVTMLGVGGLAVSLAVKDSLANLAGGFLLLFAKPFKVGDFIELEDLSGTVDQIGIFQTKLVTFDNKAVYIPNGQLSAARIVNYSAEETRLLAISVGVSYHTDLSRCKELLLSLLSQNEMVCPEPEPAVRIMDYGESAIQLSVRAWVKTSQYWDLKWELMEKIKEVFDQSGIEIPFRQVDVYLKNAPAAASGRDPSGSFKTSD